MGASDRLERPRRGVSLGLVGLSFFLCQPLGLALAWWHPAFRGIDGRRDRLLVLAVLVYLVVLALSIALSLEEPVR